MNKRYAIIGLYSVGTPIIKDNKSAKSKKFTVYDVVRRYKELGNTKDFPKSGGPRSCLTKNKNKKVREKVRRDSICFMRKMALDFKMDPKSMRPL